jgi:CheY-like chemotaxis protein
MKVRLLIVDDDPAVTERLAEHFRASGYDVRTAADALEAMARFQTEHFQVVITDLVMPGMTGVELLRAIREYGASTHVIVMTGYCALEYLLTCMRLGADACILKPIEDLGLLDEKVDAAVGHLQHWQDVMARIHQMRPAQADARAGGDEAADPAPTAQDAQDMVAGVLRDMAAGTLEEPQDG